MAKRKVTASKKARKTSALSFKKRRGEAIYDLVLPRGAKDRSQIDALINKSKINLRDLPDNFVKVTFFAKKGKDKASITYIYDIDELSQVKETVQDVASLIHQSGAKREATKSIQRISKLKNYIQKIILEFEVNE